MEALLPDPAALLASRTTPWSSATFSGARHELRVRFGDPETAAAFAASIGEAEFGLRGHFVAEACAAAEPDAPAILCIELLTVAEA